MYIAETLCRKSREFIVRPLRSSSQERQRFKQSIYNSTSTFTFHNYNLVNKVIAVTTATAYATTEHLIGNIDIVCEKIKAKNLEFPDIQHSP